MTAKRTLISAAAIALMLGLVGCDEGTTGSDPALALLNDPPRVVLIANGQLVIVDFNRFGSGFRVRPINGPIFQVSATEPPGLFKTASVNRNGQSTVPPDPDAFDADPWDDPPDFPEPDFPDPWDDFPPPDLPNPWDVPFDGLPDPPPLPSDFPYLDLNNGTMGFNGLGPSDLPKSNSVRAVTTARISIGPQPAGMVVMPDGARILVAYAQGIAVVDRNTRTVVDRILLPTTARPYSIAVTRDGKTAYVTSFVAQSPELYVVDLASKRVITTFIQGSYATKIRMTPDGTQAWYTSFFEDSVSVIDVTSNTLGVKISNVLNAWNICFNPTGTRAYVSGPVGSGDVISVIDTSTYTVIAKIPVGPKPKSLKVTPSGRHLFVANTAADTITQIDTATNKVVRTITVGKNPIGFQFMP